MNQNFSLYLFFAFVFMLNPLCGIALIVFFCLKQGERCPNGLFLLMFLMMSFWLGSLNMTKVPASDMVGYIKMFNNTPNAGFMGTVFHYTPDQPYREPFYGLIIYLFYYVTFGNAPIFFFLLTVLMYMLLFGSMLKIYQRAECSTTLIVVSAVLLGFFPTYFNLTAQTVRQILATSFIIYAVAYRSVNTRHCWTFLIMGILTHTMVGLLVLVALIPSMYKRLSVRQVFFYLSSMIILVSFNQYFSGLLNSDSSASMINYAAVRFGTNDDQFGSVMIIYAFLLPLLVAIGISYWNLRWESVNSLYGMLNLSLFIIIFILSFYRNPYFQSRYSFVAYSLLPMIVPLAFYHKKNLSYWCGIVFSVLMFFMFFMFYNHGVFSYGNVWEVVSLPFPVIFFQSHFY